MEEELTPLQKRWRHEFEVFGEESEGFRLWDIYACAALSKLACECGEKSAVFTAALHADAMLAERRKRANPIKPLSNG